MPLSLVTAATSQPITVREATRHLQLNDSAGEPAPTGPMLALASPAALGNCDNGAWRIGFTFVTPDGETEIGPLSAAVTVADKTVNGQLAATQIALGGSNVTARKGYAIPPAGGNPKLAITINENVSTTCTINIAAASLGAEAPTVNTTADPEIIDWIASALRRGEIATRRAWCGPQTWDYILSGPPADGFLEIPLPPLQSVVSITYLDTTGATQVWASSNYVVQAPQGEMCSRGRIALAYGCVWPVTLPQLGAFIVRFMCGYGAPSAVPALLKSAMKLDIGTFYQNREGVILGGRGAAPDVLPMGVQSIYWSFKSHPTQWIHEAERIVRWPFDRLGLSA